MIGVWSIVTAIAVVGRPVIPTPVRLVRCVRGVDLPCLLVNLRLTGVTLTAAATLDSAAEARAWAGEFAGNPLIGPALRRAYAPNAPVRLLILIDRSAAMSGQRMAFARIALRGFLGALDSTHVQVALAGFASNEDVTSIADAKFVAPGRVPAILDTLSAPEPRAGSALAVALRAADARVSADQQTGAVHWVMLLTAGRAAPVPVPVPPIRRRGRTPQPVAVEGESDTVVAQAFAAAASAGARNWVVQIGTDAAIPDLPVPADSLMTFMRVAQDPNALATALDRVTAELAAGRVMLWELSSGTGTGLARGTSTMQLTFRPSGGAAVVRTVAWHPPVFAAPAFQGVADLASLSPAMRDALLPGADSGASTGLIALILAVLLAATWTLIPRIAWVRAGAMPNAPAPTMSTTRLTAAVREAEPRRPEDITHQTARRTAMQR